MKKFIDSVKALGEKMTGKEIEGTKLIDVIDETAENYQGGGGSGSEVVDALPAQGKEGNTYLLRKTESNENEIPEAQCYMPLYNKQGSVQSVPFMIDDDIQLFVKEITTKLNPELSKGLVDFSSFELLEGESMSSDEWQTFTTSNKVAIVKTEEEISKISEDVDYIFQDLGEIRIENIPFIELKQSRTSSGVVYELASVSPLIPSYSFRVLNQGGNTVIKMREIEYNSEATSEQPKYSFTEWQEFPVGPFVDTLTDTYMYDQETLAGLEEGSCYFINLTPVPLEVTYSYTQYVFDQGVYTVVGGEKGAGGQGDQYAVNALWVNTILANSVKPKNYGFNLRQFILDYVTEAINIAYHNVFCLISAQNLPDNNGENYSTANGIYVGLGTYNDENYIFVFQAYSFSNAYELLSDIGTLDDAIAYYRVATQKDNFYDTLLANVTDEPITGMYEDLVDQISSTAGTGNCVAKNIKFESAATGDYYCYSFFRSWSLNDVLSYFLQLPRVK